MKNNVRQIIVELNIILKRITIWQTIMQYCLTMYILKLYHVYTKFHIYLNFNYIIDRTSFRAGLRGLN